MTRKRYIKLLMSRGYDRNQAQREAEQARKVSSGLLAFCEAVAEKMRED